MIGRPPRSTLFPSPTLSRSYGSRRRCEGFRLMDMAVPAAAVSTEDFFPRARARLSREVPPALHDPTAAAKRGDIDLDPDLWQRAGVTPTRAAAVLIPVVDRPQPQVLLTLRTELPSHP